MQILASGVRAAVAECILDLTGEDDVSIMLEDSPAGLPGG